MPICHTETERLTNEAQREFQETTAKRRKLEEAIHKIDVVSKRLIEKAALRDIEAHKSHRPSPSQVSHLRADGDRQPRSTLQEVISKVTTARFIETKKDFLPAQSGPESLPLPLVGANATVKSSERFLT